MNTLFFNALKYFQHYITEIISEHILFSNALLRGEQRNTEAAAYHLNH